MPLDRFDSHDFFYERCIGKQLVWSFWPRKCYNSGKLIWFTTGYKLTAMYTGPGFPEFEYRWFDRKEYIIAVLAGKITWER